MNHSFEESIVTCLSNGTWEAEIYELANRGWYCLSLKTRFSCYDDINKISALVDDLPFAKQKDIEIERLRRAQPHRRIIIHRQLFQRRFIRAKHN